MEALVRLMKHSKPLPKLKSVPFAERHLKISRAWMNDRELCRLFNRVYKPLTVETQKKWYQKVKKDKTQVIFAIEVDGVYVGNIGFKNIDKLNKKAEYYIIIGDRNYWGKGIGTSATEKILQYARKHLKLHKVYLYVDQSNMAAQRLYQKTGFQEEGILKDELLRDKKYLTMLRMAYFFK